MTIQNPFWSRSLLFFIWWFGHVSVAAEHPDARQANIAADNYSLLKNTQQGLSIDTAQTLRHLDMIAAADLGYIFRPLGLRDRNSGAWVRSLVEHRETLKARLHLGLLGFIDLGLEIPGVINQTGQFGGARIGPVPSAGLGDMGIYTKLKLIPGRQQYNIALANELRLPTGRDNAWMGNDVASYEPAVILSRWKGSTTVSFRLAYRIRQAASLFDVRDGSRFVGGVGAIYRLPAFQERLSLSLEATGSLDSENPFSGINQNGARWASGMNMAWTPSWHTGIVAGSSITKTFGNPAFFSILSVEYRHAFVDHPPDCSRVDAYIRDPRCPAPDKDRDGLPDHQDRCPSQPEDKDGFEDTDGCPDVDNDQDGIKDPQDRCPNKREDRDGFEDTDGCPDLDNDRDGIDDSSDACPLEAEIFNKFQDDDGCPEPDQDKDGIVDGLDKCPDAPEDKDGFEDEDGCPDLDNDQDGILDPDDRCPNQPEKMNGFKDKDGCPDEKLAVKTNKEIVITEEIYFLLGQVVPRKRSRRVLRAVHQILTKHPTLRVRVEGHTDGRGGTTFNRYLSQARAQAIKDMLVRWSADKDAMEERLDAVGLGASVPDGLKQPKAIRAKNRRVRFMILDE